MPRQKTTGRFDTRDELLEFVCRKYYTSTMNNAQIARSAGVSESTAANILDGEEAIYWQEKYRHEK